MQSSPVFAAIDIGTNSIRLAIVREEGGSRLTTLAMHREAVRLGEGEFDTGQMTPAAIARGALVCAKFAEVARGFGADPIVALATSAVREADNREEFIERVRQEAGIEVRVISGVEEARLIWLGVSSGVELAGRTAALIDIGGGSTEFIVGDSDGHKVLESMKLGCIRITNQFFPDSGPVSLEHFARVQGYILGVSGQVVRRVRQYDVDFALGSAGTIGALGEIVARQSVEVGETAQRGTTIRTADLRLILRKMCGMTLEERLAVPGMDANRADIILGGGAILLTLLEGAGIDRIGVSDRGLRDGILMDHMLREDDARVHFQSQSVQRRSILALARSCKFEEAHAVHTAKLALRLFDELKRLGAHSYGDEERTLLEYGALTHDIGTFLSHTNHQKHAYYLIRNSDLLGFTDTELDIIANIALYHRKGLPKKRHENLIGLDRHGRKIVSVLAAILRVAEGLDRSHLSAVEDIRLDLVQIPKRYVITLVGKSDCQLEVWGVQNSSDLFEYTFGLPLEVRTAGSEALPA